MRKEIRELEREKAVKSIKNGPKKDQIAATESLYIVTTWLK
jgi:hypothetical protein